MVKVTTAHISEIYTADIREMVKARTFPLSFDNSKYMRPAWILHIAQIKQGGNKCPTNSLAH